MRPFRKLRLRIEDLDIEQRELAGMLGICKSTLSLRMNGKSAWTSDEISKMCDVLHIPQGQIGAYFFPDVAEQVKEALI